MADVKKVKVKLLVSTAYQGPRREGDVIAVPEDFAKRWVKNGIAEYATGKDAVQEKEPVVKEEKEPETGDNYEGMSAKELFTLCKEKGLDVEAKKSKEYYIEQLSK